MNKKVFFVVSICILLLSILTTDIAAATGEIWVEIDIIGTNGTGADAESPPIDLSELPIGEPDFDYDGVADENGCN